MGDEHFAKILADTTTEVDNKHWSLMGIGGGPDSPSFHYTVGLHCQDLPELIVFGLPFETGGIVNAMGERLCEPDYELRDGGLAERIITGYAVKLRLLGPLLKFHVEDELDYFGYLLRFAKHHRSDPMSIEAVQMLLPDKEGRFSDDPASAFHNLHPLLRGARDAEDRPNWPA